MSTVASTPDAVPVSDANTVRRPMVALMHSALALWRTRVGLVLTLLIVAIAILGPLFAPYSPTEFVDRPNSAPSADASFGTDHLGQDVLTRFLYGGRSILLLAFLSTLLGMVTGMVIGLLAAYSRGALDEFLMRTMDVVLAFPQIILALLVIAMFGASNGLLILVVGITTMPRIARVTRGAALPFVEREFVASALAIGEKRRRILLNEILPNILSPLVVETALRLTYSIAIIASLAFLGFTTSNNAADWGRMIQENQLALTTQPWGSVLPMIAIALLTIGTGLVGDGLSRAAAGIDRRLHT